MSSEPKYESEKTIIENTIKNSINWALNKDKDLLYSCLAQDSGFFIFNPDNAGTIIGFDKFSKMVENVFMSPAFKAIGSEFKDMRITLSRSGEAAWFSCYLDDYGEWNGQPASWENARWTGVLEKRDGHWVICQMHFSFGTDAGGEKESDE